MAGKAIDNLSIIVSANTRTLGKDLADAARQIEQFNKKMERERARAGQPPRTRDPAAAPMLDEWMRGGKKQPRFGVQPGPGGPFNEFNRAKADAGRRAEADAARADAANLARAAKLDADIALARQRQSTLPMWQRQARDQLSRYGQPGLGSRAAGFINGAGGFVGGFAGAGMERTAAAAKAAGGSFRDFARDAASVATGLVAVELGLASAQTAFTRIKEAVQLSGELEQTRLAFEVMLRSAEKANALVADMRRYAASTPFGLSEITASTRMLTAYGVAADQLMPTIRMLGDVSAAFGKELPIRDLTYLYGTLYSQQRAYAIDIRQFAGRGIPIYEELAKVLGKTNAEVKQMIEDGRVSSREVTQAFLNMTAAGGRFYGLTERQGKTFLGQWEQMVDAFRLAQTAFGGVLIEELGLPQATRELQAFAQRLEEGVGGEKIRKAVRFVGDLAKAAAQVGYEFTRAGFAIAEMNFESFTAGVPGLREAGERLRAMIKDAAGFKIDPREAIRFGHALGTSLAEAAAEATRAVGVYGAGMTALFEMVVKSARQARDYMAESADWLKRMNDAAGPTMKFLVNPGILVGGWVADRVNERRDPLRGRAPGDPVPTFAVEPPVPGMSADRVREEWSALVAEQRRAGAALATARARGEVGPLQVPTAEFERIAADRDRRVDRYLGGFDAAPEYARDNLNRGNVPAIRPPGPIQPPDNLTQLERELGGMRQRFAEMTGVDAARFRAPLDAARDRLMAAEDVHDARTREAAMAAEATRTAEALAVFRRNVAMAGQPLHDLGMASLRESAILHAEAGLLGAAFVTGDRGRSRAAGPAPGVRLPDVFPHLEELTRDLRREYDPRQDLSLYRRDLDMIRERRMLGDATNAVTDMAWRKKVQEAASRMGIGQRYELPSATEAGSAEDARLINAWRTQPQQTVEQLLAQIEAHVRQMLGLAENLPVAPPPRAVRLPGD